MHFAPPALRDIANWGLATAAAVALWYTILDTVFDNWRLYDVLEDIAEFMPGLVICFTMGLFIGVAQGFALPQVVAGFRRDWMVHTTAWLGGGFFVVYLLETLWDIEVIELGYSEELYLRGIIILTILAAPLLWNQINLISKMQLAYWGPQPQIALTPWQSPWLWIIPNILFLWVANWPDVNAEAITVLLLLWGVGTGFLMYWLLAPPEET